MGTTPTYALPYPELTDVANVPADMRELAEAVEGSMGAYSTPRAARLKSVPQTLTAAATYYTLTYETDQANGTGITYSNGIFTVSRAGVYQVNAFQHFTLTGTAQVRLAMNVDGASSATAISSPAATSVTLTLGRSWRMNAGSTFSITAQGSTAGQVAYGSSAAYSTVDITLIAS